MSEEREKLFEKVRSEVEARRQTFGSGLDKSIFINAEVDARLKAKKSKKKAKKK